MVPKMEPKGAHLLTDTLKIQTLKNSKKKDPHITEICSQIAPQRVPN